MSPPSTHTQTQTNHTPTHILTHTHIYIYISESEARKEKAKLTQKYIRKQNMKSFSNETLRFLFRKFCFSYILDLAQTA